MQTSDAGLALIKAFEGLYLKTYKDMVGVLTIGYGHTDAAGEPKVRLGQTITEKQANDILANDLKKYEYDVRKYVTVPLTQSEFDALVSFHFNTGAIKSGSVDDKLNRGDKKAAMATLLQYVNAGPNKNVKGLVRRRNAEKLLFEGKVKEALELAGAKNVPQKPIITQPSTPKRTLLDFILDFIMKLFTKKG